MPDDPPVVVLSRRSWIQRGVWLLDSYGRVVTLVAVGGLSVGIAAVAVSIFHAVSKLSPWPWLFYFWGGLGITLFVMGTLAVIGLIGGKLIVSERANSCWSDSTSAPNYGYVLTGTLLITNTDPNLSLHPTRVRIGEVKLDGEKEELKFEGTLMPATQQHGWEIAAGRSAQYRVDFVSKPSAGVPLPNPSVASVRLDVRDQFQRWHRGRGRIEFLQPPKPIKTTAPPGEFLDAPEVSSSVDEV